jgi:L-rhamnonate dehydratase
VKITRVRTTPVGFSREPVTLRRNLVSPTSIFPEPRSWFGPCSVVIAEVETDEGLTGIGTAGGFSAAAKAIIDSHLADLVLGKDPFCTELLWDTMYRATARLGRRGVAIAAISAIDIALWDLKGKALGRPVYELIGGRTKEEIPVYASRLYAYEDLDELAH